jgi:hypothetical protein
MTDSEIWDHLSALRDASTDAQELLELLDEDPLAGAEAFRQASDDAREMVLSWLDPSVELTARMWQGSPRWSGRVARVREKIDAGTLRLV